MQVSELRPELNKEASKLIAESGHDGKKLSLKYVQEFLQRHLDSFFWLDYIVEEAWNAWEEKHEGKL